MSEQKKTTLARSSRRFVLSQSLAKAGFVVLLFSFGMCLGYQMSRILMNASVISMEAERFQISNPHRVETLSASKIAKTSHHAESRP